MNVAEAEKLFSIELADMLTFEETPMYVVIKAKHYMPKETFSKVAAIVRQAGGEYISLGKESHFRIPTNTQTVTLTFKGRLSKIRDELNQILDEMKE